MEPPGYLGLVGIRDPRSLGVVESVQNLRRMSSGV